MFSVEGTLTFWLSWAALKAVSVGSVPARVLWSRVGRVCWRVGRTSASIASCSRTSWTVGPRCRLERRLGGIGFWSWASAVRCRGIVSPSVGCGMSNRTFLLTLGTSNRTCSAVLSSEAVGVAGTTLCCCSSAAAGVAGATLCCCVSAVAGVAGAVLCCCSSAVAGVAGATLCCCSSAVAGVAGATLCCCSSAAAGVAGAVLYCLGTSTLCCVDSFAKWLSGGEVAAVDAVGAIRCCSGGASCSSRSSAVSMGLSRMVAGA